MSEAEHLSSVIGDIYDAAIDPQLWPSVLEHICGFVGGFAASIFIHDAAARNVNFVCQWGGDPQSWAAYDATYARINPAFPLLLLKETGTVLANVDIVPEARLRLTRFYKEWLEPQGFVDTVGAVLEKSLTGCAAFAILRNAEHGIVDAPTRRRLSLIVPHLQRAVLIGKTIELKSLASDSLTSTLDALSTAVYLLGPDREILHSNLSGTTLRGDDSVLTSQGKLLQARDPGSDERLRAIFASALSKDGHTIGKAAATDLSGTDGEPYVAHVLPLGLGTRGRVNSYHGAAFAVFVHQATLWRPTLVESVADRFGLTTAEVRVLFALLELGGVPEVAPVLGVSQMTVKTHLKHIFRKTRTKRQADLVKLVAEFANRLTL